MMSSIFLITVDLRVPGQNYERLYEAIRSLPRAFRYQQSSWFAQFSGTTLQLRNYLGAFIDLSDKLLVARVAEAAYFDSDLLVEMADHGFPVTEG
ncbi:MAG: hypothetical protein V2I27_02310 [Erythrobacter sp.]|jgi:hypothetical protein|nr:hypothetical protein [Erythrobacter sp.]